jgi:hypothetical protein
MPSRKSLDVEELAQVLKGLQMLVRWQGELIASLLQRLPPSARAAADGAVRMPKEKGSVFIPKTGQEPKR